MERLEQVNKQLGRSGWLMLPDPLTNFEMQKHYQNEPKCNALYFRDNLPKITNGAYVVNLDEHK